MNKKNELEKIKEEISSEIKPSADNKTSISWGSKTITMVLVVLALISVFQVFQSASVLSKIKSGAIKSSNASTAPLPSSLDSLPNMVGGC